MSMKNKPKKTMTSIFDVRMKQGIMSFFRSYHEGAWYELQTSGFETCFRIETGTTIGLQLQAFAIGWTERAVRDGDAVRVPLRVRK
jgi:hypothetical protein